MQGASAFIAVFVVGVIIGYSLGHFKAKIAVPPVAGITG